MNTTAENMKSCIDRLALWDRVTVSHVSRGHRESFETRIEDFDSQALFVTLPDNHQGIHYGAEAELSFLHEDGLYKVAVILDTTVVSGRNYLSLTPLSRVRHEQRRAAVRVSIHIDLDVAQIDRPVERLVDPSELYWEPTTSVDFSSTGILVHGTRKSTVGDLVALRFNRTQLPQAPEFGIASWRRLQKANDVFNVGLEFISRERLERHLMFHEIQYLTPMVAQLRESHINAFSKFVFDFELKQRQRGGW